MFRSLTRPSPLAAMPVLLAGILLAAPAPAAAVEPSDLAIRFMAPTFRNGSVGRYSVTVMNLSDVATEAPVAATFVLPQGFTLVQGGGAGFECGGEGNVVECLFEGTLRARGSLRFHLDVDVCSTAARVATVAILDYPGDPQPLNNVYSRSSVLRSGPCAPTPTPTGTPTPTATPSPTLTPATHVPEPTVTATATPSPTVTATPTPLPDATDLSVRIVRLDTFQVGRMSRYSVTVRNHGPNATNLPVVLSSEVPRGLMTTSATGPGWGCTLAEGRDLHCVHEGSLPPGATAGLVLALDVDEAAVPSVATTVRVSYPGDTNPANDVASRPTTVRSARGPVPTRTPTEFVPPTLAPGMPTWTPTPTATLTPSPTPVPDATDLRIAIGRLDAFQVGADGRYSVAVRNGGPRATNLPVIVSSLLPAGLSFVHASGPGWDCSSSLQELREALTCVLDGVLPAGLTTSFTLVVRVAEEARPSVVTTVRVAYPGDTNPANDTASRPTTVRAASGPVPTSTVTHTPTPTFPTATPTATPTMTPTGTPDPVATDLRVAIARLDAFRVGGLGRYSIEVRNSGSNPTNVPVFVTSRLPEGLSFAGIAGSAWSCSASGQDVACWFDGVLTAGETTSFILATIVGSSAVPSVVTTVRLEYAGDTNPANNVASSPTTVRTTGEVVPTWTPTATASPTLTPILSPTPTATATPVPDATDLRIAIARLDAFRVGSPARYAITVRNNGPAATNLPVVVTSRLPAGLEFEAADGEAWSCSASGQDLRCLFDGALALGAAADLTLMVQVGQAAAPSVVTTVRLDYPGDTNPSNDTASSPTTVRG